ncbi:MAG TPA: tetratricopeptide repeat protein [Candidatus Binatia bacterium]|nr:tetratricopeptide repeat protein [Candidatus Binatia bacterium]
MQKAKVPVAPVRVENWEAFLHANDALLKEIKQRAGALKKGPAGNEPAELASLRMTNRARGMIEKGSPGSALELLERSISMYKGNGYAYMFLAYVHHLQGRSARGAEFLSSARRYLPDDPRVHGELEGLSRSIKSNTESRAPATRRAS